MKIPILFLLWCLKWAVVVVRVVFLLPGVGIRRIKYLRSVRRTSEKRERWKGLKAIRDLIVSPYSSVNQTDFTWIVEAEREIKNQIRENRITEKQAEIDALSAIGYVLRGSRPQLDTCCDPKEKSISDILKRFDEEERKCLIK